MNAQHECSVWFVIIKSLSGSMHRVGAILAMRYSQGILNGKREMSALGLVPCFTRAGHICKN